MSITTEIHNAMYKSMEEHYNSRIKDEPYNHTTEGIIVSVLGGNQYSVKINNIDYLVPGTEIPSSSYTVGMTVWIEIPNQKFSQKYIKCKKPY